MKIEHIEFGETDYFSPIFLDYISGNKALKNYYDYQPNLQSFETAIANKEFDQEKRTVLQNCLLKQYKGTEKINAVEANIASITNDNTFTVTTGHQLNIFTGPLYFIYKIVTTINLARALKEKYPSYNFVPVYWMASEDHDFEEINHFRLFGRKIEWNTDQKGAVGEFNLSGIENIFTELQDIPEFFKEAYLQSNTLAEAVRKYVHHLFGKYGLLIIDADDHHLKNIFTNVIHDDVCNHHANDLAEKNAEHLVKLGYGSQVFPRAINFFYKDKGLRERIVKQDQEFSVLNTDITFSREQLLEEIKNTPEHFSPNVILRPLYQESILPNLAYIGGPSELAYWLQISDIFRFYKVPMPVLIPRNCNLYISKAVNKKISKLGYSPEDFFKSFDDLKNKYVADNSENEFDLKKEMEALEALFSGIEVKAMQIDQSLQGAVKAELARTSKSMAGLEKRLKKSEERSMETGLKQIEGIYDKLFPNGSLQERTDNFLNFYINNPQFIDQLLEVFDPFDFRFYVITEDD